MYVVAHNGTAIFGGGELGTVLLLRGLQERGHRVLMLFRDRNNAERGASYGIPTGVQKVGGAAMLPDAFRLAARLKRERPDAVILTTFKKVFLAGMGARMAGVPRIVQRIVLQGDTPARGPQYRLAFRRFVDVVTLNSGAMRPDFLRGDPDLDPGRVVTLLDGVRTPARTREPGALRREIGLPDGARTLGAVARLSSQKRFDRLVRALAALPADVHAVIAGEGPQRPKLEALADELGVRGRLHLVGFRTDVGDVLDALDLFVVCSDREGMANAMLEAMAFGVPVISTLVSGAEEALEPFNSGVAPGLIVFDDDDLVRKATALLEDPARCARMGQAARQRVKDRFGYEAWLDQWERLLEAR